MRVTVTGATGRIGRRLVETLKARGDEVAVLSRDPDRAGERLGVEAFAWDVKDGTPPAGALAGRHAVVHLAGEDIARRWTGAAKEEIRDSRVLGTRNLVRAILAAEPRPQALLCASASGLYGARDDEPVDESAAAGDGWLAGVVVDWEREALAAADALRVVLVRTGVVLMPDGGALARMLPPFRAGIGGPVGGGDQYLPWIHVDDLVGIYVAAIDHPTFAGPINACSPNPARNRDFSKALGRALGRPAVVPVPALALRALYGEMAQIVLTGVRMVPARADDLGYSFRHPELDEALHDALRSA